MAAIQSHIALASVTTLLQKTTPIASTSNANRVLFRIAARQMGV
jgi:hypothetical protein